MSHYVLWAKDQGKKKYLTTVMGREASRWGLTPDRHRALAWSMGEAMTVQGIAGRILKKTLYMESLTAKNPGAVESVGAKLATDIIGGIGFGIGAGITERYIMRKGKKNPRRAKKNIFVWNNRRRARKNIFVWNNPDGTRKQLEAVASQVGLYVATWSPGDGTTRYRFFTKPTSYFEGEEIYTALGLKEAWCFVCGYAAKSIGRTSRNPRRRQTRGRFLRERVRSKKQFAKSSLRTKVVGKHRVIVGCPIGKYDRARQRCRVGTRAQSILHPMSEVFRLTREGRKLTVGRGPTERRIRRPIVARRKIAANSCCRNPRHNHNTKNPLLQTVMLANGKIRRRSKRRPSRVTRSVTKNHRRVVANPCRAPFKHGQRIPIEKARAWVNKYGSPELKRQFAAAERLQEKANRKPRYVIWRILPIGSSNKLDAVTAMVQYGTSPETMYKAPKGSKKGSHMYRHEWGDGSGKPRPVPVLATPGGRAMVMPLRKGQVINDWMRG